MAVINVRFFGLDLIRNASLNWFYVYVLNTVNNLVFLILIGKTMNAYDNLVPFPYYGFWTIRFQGKVMLRLYNEVFLAVWAYIHKILEKFLLMKKMNSSPQYIVFYCISYVLHLQIKIFQGKERFFANSHSNVCLTSEGPDVLTWSFE